VTAVQNEYSLWTRQPELGLIQRCAAWAWPSCPSRRWPAAPSARRWPTPQPSRWGIPHPHPPLLPRATGRTTRLSLLAFHAYARARGITPAALALAWLLDRAPHIIPIPGTRTAEHLADWLAAPEIDLTTTTATTIDRLLPVGWAWGDRYDDAQSATAERYC
jgi:aryl-alcohol dehydrogenase-like predicted oxidoreductase